MAAEQANTENVLHYKDLLIWQRSMPLAKTIYRLTRGFPGEERYRLASQMRRAAISVPSNIAEGQARRGTREFVQFLSHASGSLAELDTQTLLSVEMPSPRRFTRFRGWSRRSSASWRFGWSKGPVMEQRRGTVASGEWMPS